MNQTHEHPFEVALSVAMEDIEFELRGHDAVAWANFLLNPRRLRGSDFLMRWSQGAWSENRLEQAVNDTSRYIALAYGPSGTAPDEDVRAFELYFERLEKAGLGKMKRPDLLIFRALDALRVKALVTQLGGVAELPFTDESDPAMQELLALAVIAVECENSLWVAQQMPDYHTPLTSQKRLNNQIGLKKTAVLPTVIMKEEDRGRLLDWQAAYGVAIHIWHVFFDLAFGLPLTVAEELITSGKIEPTKQTFQSPSGPSAVKIIYKFYYHYAYPLGETIEEAKLVADHITDKNGHILPYVKFAGGKLKLSPAALTVLDAGGDFAYNLPTQASFLVEPHAGTAAPRRGRPRKDAENEG